MSASKGWKNRFLPETWEQQRDCRDKPGDPRIVKPKFYEWKSQKGRFGDTGDGTHVVVEYDSIPDAVKDALARHDKGGSGASSGKRGGMGKEWYGTDSLPQAVDLAIDGWHDARKTIDSVLIPLRERLSQVLDIVPERHLDLTGYEPDVDLFLDNELECMVDDLFVEAPKNGKVFTMLVNTTYSGGEDKDDILRRGAVVAGLVEAFTLLGLELQVYVENTVGASWSGGDVYTILTRAHAAGYNMDLDTLAFAIGHPSWLRRIIFAIQEGESDAIRESFGFGGPFGGGYGSCTIGVTQAKRINASIVIALGEYGMYDSDPVQWVLDQLEAQGVYEPQDGGF